jgi:pyruvate carboxylase
LASIEGRPGETLPPFDFSQAETELKEKFGNRLRDVDVMSYALYPQVATEFMEFRDKYGPVTKLDTRIFLVGPKVGEEFEATIEKGKTLSFKTLAVAADLTKNGLREVFFELNGQLRSVFIRDKEAVKVLLQFKNKISKRKQHELCFTTANLFFMYSGTPYSSQSREEQQTSSWSSNARVSH